MKSGMTALLLVALCGCDASPPEREAARPTAEDTIQAAIRAFDPAAFDTIRWASDSLAFERGAFVYKLACAQCHGVSGKGDAGFVNERGDTLHPPSFTQPGWRFANDLNGLRRQVFIGNTQGMPHWGLRLTATRDIDAVARYIQSVLRQGG